MTTGTPGMDSDGSAGQYRAVSHGIAVTVTPCFLGNQSDPSNARFVWSYKVDIENMSGRSVRLCRRFWRITDAGGRVEEVSGTGVVGEQPWIGPGECYSYTSGTPLETPSGIMEGYYLMEVEGDSMIKVTIPAFSLDSPHQAATLH